jgi:hypothetical protein
LIAQKNNQKKRISTRKELASNDSVMITQIVPNTKLKELTEKDIAKANLLTNNDYSPRCLRPRTKK